MSPFLANGESGAGDWLRSPSLDGVWATAPYLHNGSVPTLKTLLTAPRPQFWRRGFSWSDYDSENVGWTFTLGIRQRG